MTIKHHFSSFASVAQKELMLFASEKRDYKGRNSDVECANSLYNLISGSVHFSTPENGVLLGTNLKGFVGCVARLPFPSITISFNNNQKNNTVSKRFVVAAEFEREFFTERFKHWGDYFTTLTSEHFIFITAMEYDKYWYAIPMAIIVPENWENISELRAFPFFNGLFELQQNNVQNTLKYLSWAACAIFNLLEALSCSNVSQEIIQKEQPHLNAKRVKKGKLPIYETRCLVIEPPKAKTVTGATIADRNSPRQHLRRGHIRRLEDRNIWVNSCVVGSSSVGVIDKHYLIGSH